MAHYKHITVTALLLVSVASVQAAYTNVNPAPSTPFHFSPGPVVNGMKTSTVTFNSTAWAQPQIDAAARRLGLISAKGELALAGRASTAVDIAFKMRPSAALTIARGLALNPYILAGTVVAPLLYDLYKTSNLKPPPESAPDGQGWETLGSDGEYEYGGNKGSSCQSILDAHSPKFPDGKNQLHYCPTDQMVRGASQFGYWGVCEGPAYDKCTSTAGAPSKLITATEAMDILKTKVLPPLVPLFWPSPLEIEDPIFNPSESGTSSRALRVPVGEPQIIQPPSPNPENIPVRTKQPVVDIIPAPSPDAPGRVDVQPRDVVKDGATPTKIPDAGESSSDPTAKDVEKQPGLCDQYPDILACAKPEFDKPDGPDLETKARELTFAPQAGWGSGAGFCPAARHLHGANVDIEFTLVCDFMRGIKPVTLAVTWIIAGMLLLGARGGAAE